MKKIRCRKRGGSVSERWVREKEREASRRRGDSKKTPLSGDTLCWLVCLSVCLSGPLGIERVMEKGREERRDQRRRAFSTCIHEITLSFPIPYLQIHISLFKYFHTCTLLLALQLHDLLLRDIKTNIVTRNTTKRSDMVFQMVLLFLVSHS